MINLPILDQELVLSKSTGASRSHVDKHRPPKECLHDVQEPEGKSLRKKSYLAGGH